MMQSSTSNSLIIFDGKCNLCNSSVNRIIRNDKKNKYKFVTLQSETAKKIVEQYSIDQSKIDSIILLEEGAVYFKSTAILKITKHLSGLYPLLQIFIFLPEFFRDFIYDIVARNRYKWFGKKDNCMIPTKENRTKFIS